MVREDKTIPDIERQFSDPFTGETLDNPTQKTYKVIYSIGDRREEEHIHTLAEGKPTKAQAKGKLSGPRSLMFSEGDVTIHSIKKTEEVDSAGNNVFGL